VICKKSAQDVTLHRSLLLRSVQPSIENTSEKFFLKLRVRQQGVGRELGTAYLVQILHQ
jgi:hypothetical protein